MPPPASRGKSKQPSQPTRQSSHIHKPSHYAKRLVSGEGTADGQAHGPLGSHPDYADSISLTGLLPDFDPLDIEGAFHVDIEEAVAAAVQTAGGDPKTLHEAQSCSDWHCWKEAMGRKLSTLHQAGTWETVPHLTDKNVINSKWVFHTKYKVDGTVDKYKAQLVMRGFTQVYGVDYLETYSPVAKLAASIRYSLLPRASIGTSSALISTPCTSMGSWRSQRRFTWSSHQAI